jgi:hypothetical protein
MEQGTTPKPFPKQTNLDTHPPLGTVMRIGDARPWNVRHNRSIGRDTTLGPLGANLTPQRANHIHVFLGDEARSVIMLLGQLLLRGCVRLDSSCRIRRNERLQKDESRFQGCLSIISLQNGNSFPIFCHC